MQELPMPRTYADTARSRASRVARELLREAREKCRKPNGESDRVETLRQATEWMQQECFQDPALFGDVHAGSVKTLMDYEESRELKYGINELRKAARFMREEVDTGSMSDEELRDLWRELLEPIAHLEVRLIGNDTKPTDDNGGSLGS